MPARSGWSAALLDVRFRRALAHGMDKHGLNEALMGGTGVVTDTMLSPKAPYYPAVEAVITKYPHDPRRAQELLEKVATEEIPTIAMYYTPTITPYVAGLSGPQLRTVGDSDTLLRIWEWEWR